MVWLPLLTAVAGAVIALSGTLLADVRRGREQRARDRELERRKICLDFMVALDKAHGRLRDVAAQNTPTADRRAATSHALGESGLYGAREHLLVSGTPSLVAAGESAFLQLIKIRDAVRAGAALGSLGYHDAYHNFAEAIWSFRMAVRGEYGHSPLRPQDLDRTSWSEREDCATCAAGN